MNWGLFWDVEKTITTGFGGMRRREPWTVLRGIIESIRAILEYFTAKK